MWITFFAWNAIWFKVAGLWMVLPAYLHHKLWILVIRQLLIVAWLPGAGATQAASSPALEIRHRKQRKQGDLIKGQLYYVHDTVYYLQYQ